MKNKKKNAKMYNKQEKCKKIKQKEVKTKNLGGKTMSKGTLNKILATMLVLTLTLANIAILGTQSFALNTNLEAQGTNTNNANVNFDAYFKDENGNKIHTLTEDINNQTAIYLYVKVSEGYLKETSIKINNPNFKLIAEGLNYDEIENIDTTTNTITLNKIRKGEQVEIAIPIKAEKAEEISIDMFSKETEISINGLLVKDNSKTTKIEKTIKTKLQWKGTAEIKLEQGVIKYVAFEDENKGIVLQTKIKTNLINSNLPIEKTNIKTLIPTINGISPEKIYVTSDSTKATNGNEGTNFNESNWKKEDKTIIIEVANTINNNKITWKKDSVDEYILTFIYGEEAYEKAKTSNAQITLDTEATITAYNLETTKVTAKDKKEGTLTEQVNNLVILNITAPETINKGYMYTSHETEYNEQVTIDIAKEGIQTETTLNQNTFGTENKSQKANTEYKTTTINKDNFKTILGEEGYINIYNQNNQKILTIDKNSQPDENNNYIIYHEENTTSLKIETSKANTIGKLKIENTKTIKPTYTKEETKTLETITTTVTGKATYNETSNINAEATAITTLEEPTTKIETSINNKSLATTIKNENVEIRTILKSSDITCKLFSNPTIKIQLPEYIENVEFNEAVKILFTDELQIESGTYNPETKTLEIHLKGEQTIYNDVSVAEGPTLILNTNITLNKLTPSKTDEITTTIINGEETIERKTAINYLAPIGMVTVNEISGYNGEETATSVSGQETTGRIDSNTNAKTAEVKLTIINNNNNVCKNIQILGRTPFEGNKSIETGKDLGSTFTAKLINKINAIEGIDNSKITTYYSTNENATKDLSNAENGWILEPENLSEIKSYLIIINEYEMETGAVISLKYNAQIPEGLRNDESTYGTFVVYYDNVITKENTNTEIPEENIGSTQNNIIVQNTINTENTITNTNTQTNNTIQNNQTVETENRNIEVLIPQQAQANVVGLSTSVKPDVAINLTTDLEDPTFVVEGQVINYTATIVNMSEDTLSNISFKIPVPKGTVYREYILGTSYSKDEIITKEEVTEVSKEIKELKPNATEKIELQVMVKESKTNEDIQAKAIVSAEGYQDIESETINHIIIKGALNINMYTYMNADETYRNESEIQYLTYIQNIREADTARKVIATCIIPNELEYISSEYLSVYDNDHNKVEYNQETRTVTWTIDKIAPQEIKMLSLKCKLKPGITEVTNQMNATCSLSTQEATSNKVTRYVTNPKLEVKHYSNIEREYVDVGEKLDYHFEITNTGNAEATNIKLTDSLPSGLENVTLSYKTNIVEKEDIPCENKEVELSGFSLEPGETLKIAIKTEISKLPENAKGTIKLTNKATITADNIEEITTNEITHKIKVKDQTGEEENPKYTISGIAWLDKSRDGKRDDNEEMLKNIEVTLITKEEAKAIKTVKTDKNGQYKFEDIEKGEYLIIFAYDTATYEITKYQADGISEVKNSDAALQQTTKLNDGKTITGAITNTLKLENQNLYNIDIGLLESMKFDLSLNKTITKVSKQDDNGIKTYDYSEKGKTLAKVEIPSKQVNKTTIIIEYTIQVKNEGNIAGYAKQIVDYLPKDLRFASELNKDWYQATDGNLYNTSLAETIINPGETKEIKLLVTKTTNENNLGTINNSAEIAESYNNYGEKDNDSTAGNKQTKEDDYGSADLLISLNTGTIIMYTTLTITIIAIIGVGIYMIKKKVLDIK